MLGMPTVGALRGTPVSSLRIHNQGRVDLQLPSADRQVGLSGWEAGGGWVGVGRSGGEGGAEAAVFAQSAGGGAEGGLQAVSVMWEDSRTPWGGGTQIVPRLKISDALGVVEVRGALPTDWGAREGKVKEIRPYINGSMPFGEDVDVAVVASQAPGSRYGALSGTFPASGVRVSDVLAGFGCGGENLVGERAVNCDPLPPVPVPVAGGDTLEAYDGAQEAWGKVRVVLSRLGLGGESVVEDARLESMFVGRSSAEGGDGCVYHVVRGVMSAWPRCTVELFSTFVPTGTSTTAGHAMERMHFVWHMTTAPPSALSLPQLVASVSEIVAPHETAQVYPMKDLALVLSRYAVSLQDVPLQTSSSMDVAAGVSIAGTLILNDHTAVGRMLLPMLTAAASQAPTRKFSQKSARYYCTIRIFYSADG